MTSSTATTLTCSSSRGAVHLCQLTYWAMRCDSYKEVGHHASCCMRHLHALGFAFAL